MSEEKSVWVCYRNDYVIEVFNTRQEGIKYLKKLLNQTLRDINKQDKSNEYNYQVKFPAIELTRVICRESYLGL
jgi:phenolic acid decarboxylase